MKITISDTRMDHPVLGGYVIQIQLRADDGKTIGYQWPIRLGQTVDEFAAELHQFADRLKKEYGGEK